MEMNPQNESQLRLELQRLVQSLEAAGRASLPLSNDALLQSIAAAAARIFQAAAASILLVNEAEGVLEFRVATNSATTNLVGMRIPLDKGIAGYVAMTGQPIAISNVEQDARFNREFAKSVGYIPRSILATPLLSGERVLGVMEVLDKLDSESFGMQDMELLGLFAAQAAQALEISNHLENLGDTLLSSLKVLARQAQEGEESELASVFEQIGEPEYRSNLLQLAALMSDFSQLGEAEQTTALKILSAFRDYSLSKRKTGRSIGRR
jgi:GAF domain-containing protein